MLPTVGQGRKTGGRPKRLSLRYQGREVTVGEGRKSATLGRAEDNDVVVKGNLISRIHARIEINRNKFVLIDQSTNGTFVQAEGGEELFGDGVVDGVLETERVGGAAGDRVERVDVRPWHEGRGIE